MSISSKRHAKSYRTKAALEARVRTLEEALYAAAMSLETIAHAGGSKHLSDGLLEAMSQVRGYARNRAGVARAALAGEEKRSNVVTEGQTTYIRSLDGEGKP
jgi:hypothetical protein